MNIQQLLDEAQLCGSPGGCYLRDQKAIYTAEPPDISNELTIVSKYHHGGHQFHLQTVYCDFQNSDYWSICLVLAAHPVPKTNLTVAFSFVYFLSFVSLYFLLSIFCYGVNVKLVRRK